MEETDVEYVRMDFVRWGGFACATGCSRRMFRGGAFPARRSDGVKVRNALYRTGHAWRGKFPERRRKLCSCVCWDRPFGKEDCRERAWREDCGQLDVDLKDASASQLFVVCGRACVMKMTHAQGAVDRGCLVDVVNDEGGYATRCGYDRAFATQSLYVNGSLVCRDYSFSRNFIFDEAVRLDWEVALIRRSE